MDEYNYHLTETNEIPTDRALPTATTGYAAGINAYPAPYDYEMGQRALLEENRRIQLGPTGGYPSTTTPFLKNRCSRDQHFFECKHELNCECGKTSRVEVAAGL